MYYIIYGFLYLLSLLPFFVLYRLSDLVYILLFYVFGYRKKVVLYNLSVAFPEKSERERKKIAAAFYRNLTDTFIETIKMISMSGKTFDHRCTINMEEVNALTAMGLSVQLHSGHQMNWEYANWIFSRHLQTTWIGIYSQIANKSINRIFFRMRSKFGTELVSTKEFKTVMHTLFKRQYGIGLAADQNTNPDSGYWMYFFSQPVPFITGPDKGAIKNKTAVVFVKITKKKRGYYHFENKVITENAAGYTPGELTRLYRDFLEETIRQQPDNYLWSHRRWRHPFKSSYAAQWIDNRPMPVS